MASPKAREQQVIKLDDATLTKLVSCGLCTDVLRDDM
jgi:hypothetical protein